MLPDETFIDLSKKKGNKCKPKLDPTLYHLKYFIHHFFKHIYYIWCTLWWSSLEISGLQFGEVFICPLCWGNLACTQGRWEADTFFMTKLNETHIPDQLHLLILFFLTLFHLWSLTFPFFTMCILYFCSSICAYFHLYASDLNKYYYMLQIKSYIYIYEQKYYNK